MQAQDRTNEAPPPSKNRSAVQHPHIPQISQVSSEAEISPTPAIQHTRFAAPASACIDPEHTSPGPHQRGPSALKEQICCSAPPHPPNQTSQLRTRDLPNPCHPAHTVCSSGFRLYCPRAHRPRTAPTRPPSRDSGLTQRSFGPRGEGEED